MGWLLRLSLPDDTIDDTEAVTSLLWEAGTTGVAGLGDAASIQLEAGFGSRAAAQLAANTVNGRRPVPWAAVIEEVDDVEWAAAIPSAMVDLRGRLGERDVCPAFGPGGHPTTRLALDLAGRIPVEGSRVLDFGSGTGVLALDALAAGADRVVAVENDEPSFAVAAANTSHHRDLGPGWIELRSELPPHPASFDLVLANVLLPVHRAHGPRLDQVIADGGSLVVTGIVQEQCGDLLACYPNRAVKATRQLDGWVGLLLG